MLKLRPLIDLWEHTPPFILKNTMRRALWEGAGDSRSVALTFDDGPDVTATPAVLDVLDEYRVHAAFFFVGKAVMQNPETARDTAMRGHTIGIHSMTHRRMLFMPRDEMEREIDNALQAVRDACDVEPKWFRPPYGVFNPKLSSVIENRGLKMALWSVCADYENGGTAAHISERLQKHLRPGALIMLRDAMPKGGETLPFILRRILDMILDEGLQPSGLDSLENSTVMENIR
jgi:peptidoglycan/xylan/chitin deacetylase (PgdA/CDA1 family)